MCTTTVLDVYVERWSLEPDGTGPRNLFAYVYTRSIRKKTQQTLNSKLTSFLIFLQRTSILPIIIVAPIDYMISLIIILKFLLQIFILEEFFFYIIQIIKQVPYRTTRVSDRKLNSRTINYNLITKQNKS